MLKHKLDHDSRIVNWQAILTPWGCGQKPGLFLRHKGEAFTVLDWASTHQAVAVLLMVWSDHTGRRKVEDAMRAFKSPGQRITGTVLGRAPAQGECSSTVFVESS